MTTVNQAADRSYRTAVEKGWWDRERPFPEQVALMHSELSEALEAWRSEEAPPVYRDFKGKPEGWAIELIDCLIRIFDCLRAYNLDVEELLKIKMDYNDTRPYRHGGKRI